MEFQFSDPVIVIVNTYDSDHNAATELYPMHSWQNAARFIARIAHQSSISSVQIAEKREGEACYLLSD